MDPIRHRHLEWQDYIEILHFNFCKNLNFLSKAVTPVCTERKIKYINSWGFFSRKWVLFKAHFLISKGRDSSFLARLDVTVLLGSTQTRVWQLENPSSCKRKPVLTDALFCDVVICCVRYLDTQVCIFKDDKKLFSQFPLLNFFP